MKDRSSGSVPGVVLGMDEKSQIQALERTQPSLPLRPGRAGTLTHEQAQRDHHSVHRAGRAHRYRDRPVPAPAPEVVQGDGSGLLLTDPVYRRYAECEGRQPGTDLEQVATAQDRARGNRKLIENRSLASQALIDMFL